MYNKLITPSSLEGYNIFRGVTDFGNVAQFMAFEGGRPFVKIINGPRFLDEYAKRDSSVMHIVKNYYHLLEYEFLGLDGLDDINTETFEINDGIRSLNLINKTIESAATTVNLSGYRERSGGLMWRFHDMFIRGITDGGSGFKHYHGLIESGDMTKSYANEIFNILYFVTDQTGLDLECAYLLSCGQLTTAYQFANTQRGEFNIKEITVDMNCFPVRNDYVNALALDTLKNMTITRNSANFKYYGTTK